MRGKKERRKEEGRERRWERWGEGWGKGGKKERKPQKYLDQHRDTWNGWLKLKRTELRQVNCVVHIELEFSIKLPQLLSGGLL